MSIEEHALTFACEGDAMLGVLACPPAPGDVAMILVVGGPQYRAGSHRHHVMLARAVAQAGIPTLRFDHRGMGDSEGRDRDFEFEISADIGAALDAVQSRLPSVKRFVLWGLCGGATAALLYCDDTHDPRVVGLCLANPWIRTTQSQALTRVKHYYLQRLLQPAFWSKLGSGGVGFGALSGLFANLRAGMRPAAAPAAASAAKPLPYTQRMALGWRNGGAKILLLLSENDYTAKEFVEFTSADSHWRGALKLPGVTVCHLAGSDHTFSQASAESDVESATLQWITSACPRMQD